MTLRVFIGVDPRQPLSYNVCRWSIERRASVPTQVIPLILPQLPIHRRGLTEFTYSRFLVPWLSGFKGYSIFLDADMLVRTDLNELTAWAQTQPIANVYVVKNREHFEWPSFMLFNNAACQKMTPAFIDDESNKLYDFKWAHMGVGELPPEWNHCVGYDEPRTDAKVVHYTMGIPHFPELRVCEYADEWQAERESMLYSVSWLELMGKSRHAERVVSALMGGKQQTKIEVAA